MGNRRRQRGRCSGGSDGGAGRQGPLRPNADGRGSDAALAGLPAALDGYHGPAASPGAGRSAGDRARIRRRAVPRCGVEREPGIRLHQAGLPAQRRLGEAHGGKHRRTRRRHRAEGGFLQPPDRGRDGPHQFRAHQSRGDPRDEGTPRGEPPPRLREPRRHPRQGQGPARRRAGPAGRIRGRRRPRGHPGGGGLPERAAAAHSVCARDRDGLQVGLS